MKLHPGFGVHRALTVATLALALAGAGCASATPMQHVEPEPAACASAYLDALRAEHEDRLSDNARERLAALERECRLARAATAREDVNRTADHHMDWMGSGLAMALMMVMMWTR